MLAVGQTLKAVPWQVFYMYVNCTVLADVNRINGRDADTLVKAACGAGDKGGHLRHTMHLDFGWYFACNNIQMQMSSDENLRTSTCS